MKKKILVSSLVVGALLTGSLALAVPGGFGGGNCGGGKGQTTMTYEQHEERMGVRLEKMATILDLSEEQKTQIGALLNQQWQGKQNLREQMQASKDALREIRSSDNFDEAEFRVKMAKQAELKTEMMVKKVELKKQVEALLTPEQQEKADKLEGLMGRHGKGRHNGQGKSHHGGQGFGS